MSFEIIGNREKAVAIVEIPAKARRKAIATAIMKQHKNVKSVLVKASARKGVYRLRKLQLIAGSKNTEVTHVESGCRILLDPRKVYFSSREGTERLRLVEKIKKGELVAVFFAGVGPFSIVIGRKSKAREIIGIEKNPTAIRYFKKNIRLNKLTNVLAVKSDVKDAAKKFPKSFDRIIMPLPEKALDFLSVALKCLRPRGTIHLYFFAKESEIPVIKKRIRKKARGVKFIGLQRVLPYSPRVWKYRIDFKTK